MSMKNYLIRIIAALVIMHGLVRADVYVSTAGSNSNSGSKEQPCRTLEHARDCVRQQLKSDAASKAPITVWIDTGSYYLDRTFELGVEDSGTNETPVVYRALPGAEVREVGGRQIPPGAFHAVQDTAVLDRLDDGAREKVLQADLKAFGITNFGEVCPYGKRPDLFFNDQWLTLARWPNHDYTKIGDVTGGKPISFASGSYTGDAIGKFTYEGDRGSRWNKEPDLWVCGYWFWDWAFHYEKVALVDSPNRTITVETPYHIFGYRKGQRYYVVSALSELDSPGEWHLDRHTGLLYLWPPGPVEKAHIVLSTLQSSVVRLKGASHIILQDLIIEATRGDGIAIEDGCWNLVAGCTIRNIGKKAVVIKGGREHGVTGCDIYEIGATGIHLDGGERRTLTPSGHFAANNHIWKFQKLRRTYHPAISLNGVGNRAVHNLIHDSPHSAILFNGNDHAMEWNEIYDVCQEVADAGAIYTGRNWTTRGNVIRFNFIHHVTGLFEVQTIYLDDMASGSVVFGNIFYKTGRAVNINGGRDNIVENNVAIDCHSTVIHIPSAGTTWLKNMVLPDGILRKRLEEVPYKQPPWSQRYPKLAKILDDDPGVPKGNIIRLNVIQASKPIVTAPDVDRFGVVADNWMTDEDLGFQDADKMDFRLRDDSAIFEELPKFQKIPFEKIGLYIDEYRKSMPP